VDYTVCCRENDALLVISERMVYTNTAGRLNWPVLSRHAASEPQLQQCVVIKFPRMGLLVMVTLPPCSRWY